GWHVDSVLYAPGLLTSSFAHDLIARLGRFNSPALASRPGASVAPREAGRSAPRKNTGTSQGVIQAVSAQVMESLADKENPQGILAVVRQKQIRLDELRHSTAAGAQKITRAMALVSPQDPGNVGTILRTLDAVGADALFLLDGGVELYHPTVVRSSMGTIFWKPIIQTSFAEFVDWSRNGNYQLIGTSAHGDVDYQTLVPKTPWILVLGNEQKGLATEQTNACDVAVSLPMKGRVSSLNLAVAAGVLLYHFTQTVVE
ncbi:MAG: RNA methyltransferase, partial [Chloroflexi bacterium]